MAADVSRTRRSMVLAGTLAVLIASFPGAPATADPSMEAVPRADCGPGSLPETAEQGRAPASDFTSGRVAQGYLCNTAQVGHFGQTAGLKVFRYVDPSGHTCAFYDSTSFFPADVPGNATKEGLGVIVLDMSNTTAPQKVANLTTPAMLSPHESLQLSQTRGLLVAVSGSTVASPGVVDVYDVKSDCRTPRLLSSTPFGVLGHESAMSPDGRTFYTSSTLAETAAAVDLSDPSHPTPLWFQVGVVYHGMSVSDDGNRLYVANIGQPPGFPGGIQILDVSQIQARAVLPQVSVIGALTWPIHSQPQIPIPITISGHPYLLEVDEFARPNGDVGAARIIDIADEAHPFVVSNIRLEANQPENRAGRSGDPGASNSQFGGYTAHYCSVPRRDDPGLVACSFILSGLRIFDIRDPVAPREVGYFNKPPSTGSGALAAPAWDVENQQVWFSDTKTGFYAVELMNGIADALQSTG